MNNSHINSEPAMPSDPTSDFEAEPACSTWNGSIALLTSESLSVVLAVRTVGGSVALGVDWLISMELVEAITSIVGKIDVDEKLEKLAREEVGVGAVLVASVTILVEVDVWMTFGLRLSKSWRDIEKVKSHICDIWTY